VLRYRAACDFAHTIDVRNTLVGRLRLQSARGRLQAKLTTVFL